MKITLCVNKDGNPIHPPSVILCKECHEALAAKFKEVMESLRRQGE